MRPAKEAANARTAKMGRGASGARVGRSASGEAKGGGTLDAGSGPWDAETWRTQHEPG